MQNCVERLLSNEQEKMQWRNLSRQVAAEEEFTIDNMVRRTSRIYLELTRRENA